MFLSSKKSGLAAVLFAVLSSTVSATVVEFQTSLGPIEVNLFDQTTPETVENFLSYVNSGAYANNVIHRSVDGFIVQGGGFQYTGPIDLANGFTLDVVQPAPAVVNEPELSNLVGTIAMAKVAGNENSATSQWFFNLSDNSSNLDVQNGGFTVFGQVVSGMQIVQDIAALDLLNAGGAFTDLPIRDFGQTEIDNNSLLTDEHLVIVSDVVVTNQSIDSASTLNPVANTLINPPTGGDNPNVGEPSSGSGGGGGAFSWLVLLTLFGLKRKALFKASE